MKKIYHRLILLNRWTALLWEAVRIMNC